MPGMYAVTSTPVVRRTRATLRSAELGFFGVCVNTRVQTPRRCGEPLSAGVFDFSVVFERPLRTSCWMVGTRSPVARQVIESRIGDNDRPATGDAPGRPITIAAPEALRSSNVVALATRRRPRTVPITEALTAHHPEVVDAHGAIVAGRVLVDGKPVLNPRARIRESAPITVEPERVLRGSAK